MLDKDNRTSKKSEENPQKRLSPVPSPRVQESGIQGMQAAVRVLSPEASQTGRQHAVCSAILKRGTKSVSARE